MTLARTTARGALLTLLALLLSAGAAAASTSAKVPTLVFPVLGEASYIDDFGDARGQGAHEGNDIMAPRRALALAAEAGTVKFHITSSRAGCMLYLEGESGTEYLYIHLNNDLTSENDNQGKCVPGVAFTKGLKSGAKVLAGEPIGYVGDSGDADGIHPHLHFEVHPNGGGAVSPYPYLRKAKRMLFAARLGTTFTLALTGTVVTAAGQDLAQHRPGALVAGRPQDQAGRPEGRGLDSRDGFDRGDDGGARGGLAYSALELLTKGLPVTIWTCRPRSRSRHSPARRARWPRPASSSSRRRVPPLIRPSAHPVSDSVSDTR